jgi:hypothetical protein
MIFRISRPPRAPSLPLDYARSRLTLVSCNDASPVPLTRKVLARPRLLERIRKAIPDPASAHMTCFTVTELERKLSLVLDLPIYGCDPSLQEWGSKSGSRKIFRETEIDLPFGFEDLTNAADIADALAELKRKNPELRKAVVKLNEGFSGEGNALFDFADAPGDRSLLSWVRNHLPGLAFEARGMTWDLYQEKLRAMGGIVEEFIAGSIKRSPSAQFRINPVGGVEAVSTHDQVLGGANGQIFLGCRFPADTSYRLDIQRALGWRRRLPGRECSGALALISFRKGRRRLASLRDRNQSAQRRHHAPVPNAAIPHRRTLRSRNW